MPVTSRLDRSIRKVFPSISKLTFNPLFKLVVDASDLPARMVFQRFRILPPNHLRIRVGVGNQLFNNQIKYLTEPQNFWMECFSDGFVNMDSTIIDIGSGCGRFAHVLRDYSANSGKFNGRYIGIDIDAEMVAWCNANFDSPRFRFLLSTDGSASYNKSKGASEPYRIPEPDGIADLIFSQSLFTHLLDAEADNYLRESYRLLRGGGHIHHSIFCVEYPPPTGGRHTFAHQVGNAYVESLAQPEAAVAYTESFLLARAAEIGFVEARINHVPWGWQPSLVARKPA